MKRRRKKENRQKSNKRKRKRTENNVHYFKAERKCVINLYPVYYVCSTTIFLCHFKVWLKYFTWAPPPPPPSLNFLGLATPRKPFFCMALPNPTSPPYLVKKEWSLSLHTKFNVVYHFACSSHSHCDLAVVFQATNTSMFSLQTKQTSRKLHVDVLHWFITLRQTSHMYSLFSFIGQF